MASEFDIQQHLENIGLWKKYPGKISRSDLFSITLLDSSASPLLQYVERLIYFNDRCRNFESIEEKYQKHGFRAKKSAGLIEKENDDRMHPLDLSTAVFLCCDHVARLDLVAHFVGCNHAFPLITKTEQLEPITMYIWPLTGITLTSEDGAENSIIDSSFKTVSAVRFGDQTVSKSEIMNIVINEKPHPTFFYRHCEGSTKNRSSLCHGMIEAIPFLHSDGANMFVMNLRGDCNVYPNQMKFLVESSVVMIFFCELSEMISNKIFLQNHEQRGLCERFLIIITDISETEMDEKQRTLVTEITDKCFVRSNVIYYKDTMHPDLSLNILMNIADTKGSCTLQILQQYATKNYFSLDIDSFRDTSERANVLCADVLFKYKNTTFPDLFPLQGKECLQWFNADLDIYKLRHRKPKEQIFEYRESLEKRKVCLRQSQLDILKQADGRNTISNFTELLSSVDEGFNKEIFLRILKLKLENATRIKMTKLHASYEKLINERIIDTSNNEQIGVELECLEEKINCHSLSLTNFFREMGQIFETVKSNSITTSEIEIFDTKFLTRVAVELIIYGYPVEIMDGRSTCIPIDWIQSVIKELKQFLGNVHVKVVTVLGIQGSGKSTLLNVMFGTQFPVSSGRCTRGVHMQLVKVSEDTKKQHQVDYFVVIDTEGLFSTEIFGDKSGVLIQKERELATFVIGISHITLINIKGEDVTYLKDLLPIIVHAFLRMKLVGLDPRCRIIHQNVDQNNREAIIRHKTLTLIKELDRQTHVACTIEEVEPRRFSDVIKFDIMADTDCLPPVSDKINGLEVIRPSFGQTVADLKNTIVEDRATSTLENLILHLWHLWNAIKKENFVYVFKNTTEMEAMLYMDSIVCSLYWILVRGWQDFAMNIHSRVSECDDIKNLHILEKEYKTEANIYMKEQLVATEKKVSTQAEHIQYVLVEDTANIFVAKCFRKLKEMSYKLKTRCGRQFERDVKFRKVEISIYQGETETSDKIDHLISSFLDKGKFGDPEIPDLIFHEWCRQQFETTQNLEFDYESDAYDCIHTYFPLHRTYIDDELKLKCITKRRVEDFLEKIPESQYEVARKLVDDIVSRMEYVLNEIKNRNSFYNADVFTNLILEVKNNKYIITRELRTTKTYETDLVLSICGTLINKMKEIGEHSVIMPSRLKEKMEDFVKSRINLTLRRSRPNKSNIIVDELSSIIRENICQSMVGRLANIFATKLCEGSEYLKTKQGLLLFVCQEILENDKILPDYLDRPEFAIENCVCRKYERVFGETAMEGENQFHEVVGENTLQIVEIVCEKLSEITFSDTEIETMQRESSVQICIEKIDMSLVTVIPLVGLRQHEHYMVDPIYPKSVIEELEMRLKDEIVLRELLETHLRKKEIQMKIKLETVQLIMESFNYGCQEICLFCGELCCSSQTDHDGNHMALMHRPIGFKESSTNLASATCWDVLKGNENDIITEGGYPGWRIQVDESLEENTFWKYIFATFVTEKAHQTDKHGQAHIPESWNTLTKETVREKLNSMMNSLPVI